MSRVTTDGLLPYEAAVEALGGAGTMARYSDEIDLRAVIGSVARSQDFDASFRPRRRRSERWRAVSGHFGAGSFPPPIDVVRLGEVYFVVDGHHRVAAARELGWTTLPARVRRVCTVAFARRYLSLADLPTKAAERRFLELFPLPDDVRHELELDRPADWARIADAAKAWAYQQVSAGVTYCCAHDLASAWWRVEVGPRVARLRSDGRGVDLGDLAVYVAALAQRDGLGQLDWANDPVMQGGVCEC